MEAVDPARAPGPADVSFCEGRVRMVIDARSACVAMAGTLVGETAELAWLQPARPKRVALLMVRAGRKAGHAP